MGVRPKFEIIIFIMVNIGGDEICVDWLTGVSRRTVSEVSRGGEVAQVASDVDVGEERQRQITKDRGRWSPVDRSQRFAVTRGRCCQRHHSATKVVHRVENVV